MEFRDAFERTVRCYKSETAIIASEGERVSYGEIDRGSNELANTLYERLGNAACAVLSRNRPEVIEAMIAGHKRGAATAQLPFRGEASELVRMCEAANVGGLIFDDDTVETAQRMLELGEFEVAFHIGDSKVAASIVEPYEEALEEPSSDLDSSLPVGSQCSVFYTSGTTSLPKAVPFNSEQLWYGAIQGTMEHGVDKTDIGVMATPWYHMVSSDAWIYPHLLAGATILLRSEFDPRATLESIAENDATGLLAVPTQLAAMNEVQENAEYDTDSLSYIRTGGSVVSESLVERTSALLSEGIYNTYGMTEAGPNLGFAHPSEQLERPGTIGKESYTYELRVVEPAPVRENPDPEATVDAGERGEVIARGPGKAKGYIDNPKAEKRSFFDDWLRTRDVARVDEDGYLFIVDRVDNMFQSGGENIYPVEVEHTLVEHDAVVEAFVYGTDDEHWGNVVSAVVITDGDVSREELDEFCRSNTGLADYKRPREYDIRPNTESIPRTNTGKIKRDEILSREEE
ncbi:class I adenylate-forming enzyme family protein [Halococcus hamelinensis]|uniref:O-succinylbenzoate--CoA ligase n=1 Tax=Halococcus hamelinensis 100A6 TaxID=1132509 RepID=M0LUZ3_9EURY|nr:class I adenylate-forming enzyme family protein [Halococcus hamelinensis]EMA37281.1 o-succinylbenzoate--CoA ligase [Halococcus hamelinensis 100A6]